MFKKVLVPVDINETSLCQRSIATALREVHQGAELHMVTVVPGFSNAFIASYFSESDHIKAIQDVAARLKSFAMGSLPEELNCTLQVLEGKPVDCLTQYVTEQNIDLVIMAAHQRDKVESILLGSVSARVAERVQCSVMLLK